MGEYDDLARRVGRLEDLQAITKLKSDYAAAVDGNDLDRLVSLFTPDAVWEGEPFGRHEGHDAIRTLMDEPEVPWSLHFVIAPSIELAADGSTARARWYLWQTATVTQPDGSDPTATVMTAIYDDHCVKVGGKWLFEYMGATVHHFSDLSLGWVEEPMRAAEQGG